MLSGILIGGFPSNALFADPEQALPEELSGLAFTASHLVGWSLVIEMTVCLKTQIRNIYTMHLKLLSIALKECCHIKKIYQCTLNVPLNLLLLLQQLLREQIYLIRSNDL